MSFGGKPALGPARYFCSAGAEQSADGLCGVLSLVPSTTVGRHARPCDEATPTASLAGA